MQLGVSGGGADHVPLLGVADGRLAVDAVARRRHVGPAGQQLFHRLPLYFLQILWKMVCIYFELVCGKLMLHVFRKFQIF